MPRRPARAPAAVRRLDGDEESKSFLAIELKARGRSFQAIGRELKCSAKAAEERVERGLSALKQQAAKEALALDLERLDRIFEGLADKGAFAGDARRALAAVKVLEQRAKYLGLNAATKHELTGANGKPLNFAAMTDEQLRAIAEGLWPDAGAAGGGGARVAPALGTSESAAVHSGDDAAVDGAAAPAEADACH